MTKRTYVLKDPESGAEYTFHPIPIQGQKGRIEIEVNGQLVDYEEAKKAIPNLPDDKTFWDERYLQDKAAGKASQAHKTEWKDQSFTVGEVEYHFTFAGGNPALQHKVGGEFHSLSPAELASTPEDVVAALREILEQQSIISRRDNVVATAPRLGKRISKTLEIGWKGEAKSEANSVIEALSLNTSRALESDHLSAQTDTPDAPADTPSTAATAPKQESAVVGFFKDIAHGMWNAAPREGLIYKIGLEELKEYGLYARVGKSGDKQELQILDPRKDQWVSAHGFLSELQLLKEDTKPDISFATLAEPLKLERLPKEEAKKLDASYGYDESKDSPVQDAIHFARQGAVITAVSGLIGAVVSDSKLLGGTIGATIGTVISTVLNRVTGHERGENLLQPLGDAGKKLLESLKPRQAEAPAVG